MWNYKFHSAKISKLLYNVGAHYHQEMHLVWRCISYIWFIQCVYHKISFSWYIVLHQVIKRFHTFASIVCTLTEQSIFCNSSFNTDTLLFQRSYFYNTYVWLSRNILLYHNQMSYIFHTAITLVLLLHLPPIAPQPKINMLVFISFLLCIEPFFFAS